LDAYYYLQTRGLQIVFNTQALGWGIVGSFLEPISALRYELIFMEHTFLFLCRPILVGRRLLFCQSSVSDASLWGVESISVSKIHVWKCFDCRAQRRVKADER
jgi:hypothetical protein